MKVNNRNLTGATAETEKAVEPSSTLGTLSRIISAFGFERSNHVQARAAQVQSGSYHPDSAATARGMVSEALLADG